MPDTGQRRKVIQPSPSQLFFTGLAVMTSFSAFASFVSSTSNLHAEGLLPCDKGCTYVRFFPSSELGDSSPKSFSKDAVENLDTIYDADLPHYVTVQNGHPTLTFAHNPAFIPIPGSLQRFGLMAFSPAHGNKNPTPVQNSTHCHSTEMKNRFKNHLSHARTGNIYFWSLIMWGTLVCLHDVLLMLNWDTRKSWDKWNEWNLGLRLRSFSSWKNPSIEADDISTWQEWEKGEWYRWAKQMVALIGILAHFPQVVAMASSFLWGLGAAEVFVAKTEDEQHACYYELPTLNALVVAVTPILLLKKTWDDIFLSGMSLLHGDFLRSSRYHVPWTVSREALPRSPTFPFIPSSVVGEYQRELLPSSHGEFYHEHTRRTRYLVLDCFKGVKALQTFCTVAIVIGFGGGPLFAKGVRFALSGLQETLILNRVIAVVVISIIVLSPYYAMSQAWPMVKKCFYEFQLTSAILRDHKFVSDRLQGAQPIKLPYTASYILKKASHMLGKELPNGFVILGKELPNGFVIKLEWRRAWSVIGPLLFRILPIMCGLSATTTFVTQITTTSRDTTVASEMSQIGFFYAWMLTTTYHSFNTPWEYLRDAIVGRNIREVPLLGLTQFISIYQKFPHLGLEAECSAVLAVLERCQEEQIDVQVLQVQQIVSIGSRKMKIPSGRFEKAKIVEIDTQNDEVQVSLSSPSGNTTQTVPMDWIGLWEWNMFEEEFKDDVKESRPFPWQI